MEKIASEGKKKHNLHGVERIIQHLNGMHEHTVEVEVEIIVIYALAIFDDQYVVGERVERFSLSHSKAVP